LLAILAKSIAIAIAILGGKNIPILIAILFPSQNCCNTIARGSFHRKITVGTLSSSIGAEGSRVWEGGVPLPTGGGIWGGDCAPYAEKMRFLI